MVLHCPLKAKPAICPPVPVENPLLECSVMINIIIDVSNHNCGHCLTNIQNNYLSLQLLASQHGTGSMTAKNTVAEVLNKLLVVGITDSGKKKNFFFAHIKMKAYLIFMCLAYNFYHTF